MSRTLAVYISGHGYGHLAQIAPVLNSLHGLCPDIRFVLRTALPYRLLSSRIRAPFSVLDGPVDVGVIQNSAISEDIHATIAAAQRFYDDFPARIRRETALIGAHSPEAVLSGISPLAFPVADQLGIPSIAVASLDWFDIYRDFLDADDPLLLTLQQSHESCDLLIKPPLSMPMKSFPRQQQVALIVDDELPLPTRPTVRTHTALIMFGGAGDPPFDIMGLGTIAGWQFLCLNPLPSVTPANVRQVNAGQSGTTALMTACDLVITKPGYGTLAECWLTGTPLAYLPRENFAEYPYLDDWLQTHAPSARMQMDDFISGNWLSAMHEALGCARRYPDIPGSGALQAAEIIEGMI
ncbi:MAG: hypothetical protein COS82_00505 [Zetaproteobacteria bacterium CG06_land_8_20_14_3_00_59_53]|nr:MAG: hypothetical protein AUK36_05250 [Zetaproteobacteria bacterium CG2_30_59_37]PIO90470.1 MAG: hypothetical protein COX56_01560 [Zetaproteobacteria bacterium CG23_combo_of_CG06-09_8_20_14_all_59_86]PIQ65941.1 MAG: hypothetical protein COV97_01120 [Zetaproteobacteria bacterium CG11_big_fil_rev_8_21_14_0_20_59_439]PIU71421.1 MAG: hypothetical protein COS82_00505 [Zetaproteobacteria bacterium CG06_land_8_20_14_3_00_59_53]PIU97677.1 MAG: hypothetical protein COS62_01485 [Zetaproteobacteria bac